jgi:predicted RNA binding protein YcfA (HicA-like mRNA interferase family)
LSRKDKLLQRLLSLPKDVRFDELERVLLWSGYTLDRTRGSHAIYIKTGHPTLTIPIRSPVKSYLIKQVLDVIEDDFEEDG